MFGIFTETKTEAEMGNKLSTSLKHHNAQYDYQYEQEKDSWWRSMSTTLALLKQASHLIEQAENQIAAQRQRIETLEKLSSTDELTGIHNRRSFMSSLKRELDRVSRDKSQGGLLIMIDLDNFKSINDTYGHEAGDAALKVVAKTLAEDIRVMDIVARLGGDEFVILFVNTTRKQALARAQNLIRTLNNISFVWQGQEIPVRASLGLKEYKRGSQIEHLFAAADANMYENKRQLKNTPHNNTQKLKKKGK
ncbi:MAG: GGDEF domain-containing protein [Alphaproteobacteria bacterium]|nr:GGDEF domain-containing protein [Alphaproteobacteria bacterium]